MRATLALLLLAASSLLHQPAAAAAADGAVAAPVRVELNRLEALEGGGCRVYLVVGNAGPAPLESLRLDLVLFGRDGVIDRRLAVEAGPLRAAKTTVRLFDVADYPCAELGSLLLNDVLACGGGAGPDCLAAVETASRAPDVAFTR
jgi:hypothetical protein